MSDVLTRPGSESDEQFRAGANEYAKLGELSPEGLETQPTGSNREDLNDRAADIVGSITYATQKKTGAMSYREAYIATHEAYVKDEEDPTLKQLGEVVLRAPSAARAQQQLDELNLKRNLSPEEAETRKKLAAYRADYNNLVGVLVEDQLKGAGSEDDQVMPEDVQGWLEKATGGNTNFAGRTAIGMQGELAAMPLLEEAGVVDPHRGGTEADTRGTDIAFARTPRGYEGVDVKTGLQRPKLPVSRDDKTGSLYLSINPSHMKGFRVKEDYVDGYVEELRNALY